MPVILAIMAVVPMLIEGRCLLQCVSAGPRLGRPDG